MGFKQENTMCCFKEGRAVPLYGFLSKQPIQKGWSEDKKYCVTDEKGEKFLLRVSPMEQYDRKKREYRLMEQVAALGVPMCKPVAFGTAEEGVYSVQTWIDGVDAEENIHRFTEEEQYAYGFEAGRILKEMHKIPAPKDREDWETYFNRKIDRKIKMYEECPIKYKNGQAFLDYIAGHRALLSGRPQTYQHGDYHIGNMMIGKDQKLYIIDFNRYDFGDPWEEFNRIVWCAQAAPFFATGMVNGYFHNAVPMQFWKLLALYISSNTLSSVPWAIPFGETQIQVMMTQAEEILRWYDNMTRPIPTWYKGVIHK
jgi:aminoglycoside phosphotransferase (APT) family kinase protein